MTPDQVWQIEQFYEGYRIAWSEQHYRVHLQGGNWRAVNPYEVALPRLGHRLIGLPEDKGDSFRRALHIDKDTRRIMWLRSID